MLSRGEIEKVAASRSQAEELLAQAGKHVATARLAMESDPIGAYQLLYDAARKALCAVLENQGLRATSRGGHIAIYEAVSAQLDPPLGQSLRPFDRMRRRRNEAEYEADPSRRTRPQRSDASVLVDRCLPGRLA
ncbi:hypothetical protein [Nonomuraea sp. NPDC046570]|uniref:hypothetical protein n=1 Tax=Nonomuraea sp. NPDC046570 TaxID=3155255 RepID=UPI00340036F8